MKLQERRAISPIIAALLLIAIAVSAGIIVYVFTTGLSGTLTGGGGQQVTQQLQLQAYTFNPLPGGSTGTGKIVNFFLKNVGSSSLTISNIYFDGIQLTQWTAAGGNYIQWLMVPSGAGNGACFAAVPTTVTLTATTSVSSGTGTATACTGGPTLCTATNFCVTFASPTTPAETLTLAAGSSNQIIVSSPTVQTTGSGHTLRIVTSTGGQYLFSVVVGRTG